MNCKRGDLAFVMFVGDPKLQENVGRVVRVIRRNGFAEYIGYGRVPCWWIRSEGTAMRAGNDAHRAFEGNMPDLALRPIRPAPETQDVKHDEPVMV